MNADAASTLLPKPEPTLLEAARQVKPEPAKAETSDAILAKRMLGITEPVPPESKPAEAKPAEAKPDEKKVEADDKAAEAKPEPEAKPIKVKAKKAEPKAEPLSDERVAEIAAKSAVAAMQATAKAEKEKPKEELPESIKKQLPALQKLEELYPDRYPKGTAEKMAKFEAAAIAYEKKWKKEHPQDEFDPDAEEHNEFYADQPNIDDRDIEEARLAVIHETAKAEAKAEAKKELEPKITQIEREQKAAKLAPEIAKAQSVITYTLMQVLNPEAKQITNEVVAQWSAEHPGETAIASQEEAKAYKVAETIAKVWNDVEDYDPNNETHQAASKLAAKFEDELRKSDPAKLVNEKGQSWIPFADYAALPEDKRAKHFTTDADALMRFVAIDTARELPKTIEKIAKEAEETAKKFGYVKAVPAKTTETPKPTPTPTPAATTSDPTTMLRSPSVGSGSPTPPTKGTIKVDEQNPNAVLQRLMRM